MNYEDFKAAVFKAINKEIKERGIEAEISTQDMLKNNHVADGIAFRFKSNTGPTFYPETMYENYTNGMSVDDIAAITVNDAVRAHMRFPSFDTELLTADYLREHAMFKIMNINTNPQIAEQTAHAMVTDELMLVPYCKVDMMDDAEGIASFRVNRDLQQKLQLTDAELLAMANDNLLRQEPVVMGMTELLASKGMLPEDMLQVIAPEGKEQMYVLTSKDGIAGATFIGSAIATEKVQEKISESQFFVICSSTEEVLIIPESSIEQMGIGPEDLQQMCMSVNADENVMEQELVLSDNVYFFNGKQLQMCNTLEEYKNQKVDLSEHQKIEPKISRSL